MWKCLKCGEEIEDDFEVCWACGTSREGIEDPAFKPAETLQNAGGDIGGYNRFGSGAIAGAVVAAVLAFVHPFLLWLLFDRRPVPLHEMWLSSFAWSLFAGFLGGIVGGVGSLRQRPLGDITLGIILGVAGHLLFFRLVASDTILRRMPLQTLMSTYLVASAIGASAAAAGLLTGRRKRAVNRR